eukprot:13703861-Ditylum_brightwellii.AAC.1
MAPEPTESQDENNDKNTGTIEQELIQEINNSLAPTTSQGIDPPSTPTGGVSWADVVHHNNKPNAMSSASATPTPAKAVSRADKRVNSRYPILGS